MEQSELALDEVASVANVAVLLVLPDEFVFDPGGVSEAIAATAAFAAASKVDVGSDKAQYLSPAITDEKSPSSGNDAENAGTV